MTKLNVEILKKHLSERGMVILPDFQEATHTRLIPVEFSESDVANFLYTLGNQFSFVRQQSMMDMNNKQFIVLYFKII